MAPARSPSGWRRCVRRPLVSDWAHVWAAAPHPVAAVKRLLEVGNGFLALAVTPAARKTPLNDRPELRALLPGGDPLLFFDFELSIVAEFARIQATHFATEHTEFTEEPLNNSL